ncbi:hypothetical protein [Streptomyces dangxiongensis]|uniref:hypothetical protein n=1 Tax=Streptomyces dangxiongensis TaxID=1442032 RepID=UPI0013CF2B2D|nr:hypothetical protein [Streptomyces dangxiongensis]
MHAEDSDSPTVTHSDDGDITFFRLRLYASRPGTTPASAFPDEPGDDSNDELRRKGQQL